MKHAAEVEHPTTTDALPLLTPAEVAARLRLSRSTTWDDFVDLDLDEVVARGGCAFAALDLFTDVSDHPCGHAPEGVSNTE